LAESQSFNGYSAPAAREPQPLQSDYMRQGAGKKNVGEPRGGWVGLRPKKDQGQFDFFMFFIVFC
jgi:hypothetical protein